MSPLTQQLPDHSSFHKAFSISAECLMLCIAHADTPTHTPTPHAQHMQNDAKQEM